jgi:hypothetical protein
MIGILESDEGNRAILGFLRLIVCDWADHLGGESIPTGYFPGNLRLIHRLRRIQPTKQNEKISQSEDDQNEEKQTAPNDNTGVQLGRIDAH